MTDWVRVRDNETGHHLSIPRSQFERRSSAYTELKSDAAYPDGTPVPPKHKTSVSAETAKKTGGQTTADTEKE